MQDTTKRSMFGPDISRRTYLQGTAVGLAGLMGSAEAKLSRHDDGRSFWEKMEAGAPVYGISAAFAGMDPVTVTAHLGTDWIWIDTEHASYGVREVREMITVVPSDTATLVRVPGANPKEVERVLDAGADGVIIPKLRTVEQVKAFVASAYYPPEQVGDVRGDRGVAGSPASTFGLDFGAEFMERSNEDVFVIIQIETPELVSNLDRVAQCVGEGIDSFLIGPADLSSQLGSPLNTDTAAFQRAKQRVLTVSQRHNIAPGFWVGLDDAEPFVEEGWRVLSLGSDAALLASAVQERLDRAP